MAEEGVSRRVRSRPWWRRSHATESVRSPNNGERTLLLIQASGELLPLPGGFLFPVGQGCLFLGDLGVVGGADPGVLRVAADH